MLPLGFEPKVPASERRQTDASDRATTEKCTFVTLAYIIRQCLRKHRNVLHYRNKQIKLVYTVQLSDKQTHGTYIKMIWASLIEKHLEYD